MENPETRSQYYQKDKRPRLIVIAGPTATGKSGLSVRLAGEIGGEIISADSMQVYKGLDIGSAKITQEEMQGVPHHLIDVLEPTADYSAAVFQKMASEAASEITARGHIPIVCGGTGFYIQALLYGIDFSDEPEDEESLQYKRMLEEAARDDEGKRKLFSMLEESDPEAAEAIGPNNLKRVIRALEFIRLHGKKISEHNLEESEKRLNGQEHSPYDYLFFVLCGDRERLYQKIDARVDRMLSEGLEEETKKLFPLFFPENGDDPSRPGKTYTAAQGIGYKEMFSWLKGEIPLSEAVRLIKRNTRRFAKRQLTWFKRERGVIWINIDEGDPLNEIRKHIQTLWGG